MRSASCYDAGSTAALEPWGTTVERQERRSDRQKSDLQRNSQLRVRPVDVHPIGQVRIVAVVRYGGIKVVRMNGYGAISSGGAGTT
jgi:hypothetical protein